MGISKRVQRRFAAGERSLYLIAKFLRVWPSFRLSSVVKFPLEKDVELQLPAVSLLMALVWKEERTLLGKLDRLVSRTYSEPLLRQIVSEILESEWFRDGQAVIDIGAWIGDNALAWARLLGDSSLVIAIDPSDANVAFMNKVADLNAITNIRIVQAACSDKSGRELAFSGNLDHTKFGFNAGTDSFVVSKTIDEIVANLGKPDIGLFHIDVEGLEPQVLQGASNTVKRCRPIVVFEGHLRDLETLHQVFSWLSAHEYSVMVINEALEGGGFPDCRNFLALPRENSANVVLHLMNEVVKDERVLPASLGGVLIDIEAEDY